VSVGQGVRRCLLIKPLDDTSQWQSSQQRRPDCAAGSNSNSNLIWTSCLGLLGIQHQWLQQNSGQETFSCTLWLVTELTCLYVPVLCTVLCSAVLCCAALQVLRVR
jgi:hypothetical protein